MLSLHIAANSTIISDSVLSQLFAVFVAGVDRYLSIQHREVLYEISYSRCLVQYIHIHNMYAEERKFRLVGVPLMCKINMDSMDTVRFPGTR